MNSIDIGRTVEQLSHLLSNKLHGAERRYGATVTAVVVGAILYSFSLLLAAPSLNVALHVYKDSRLQVFAAQSQNPLYRPVQAPFLAYRVLTPFIAYTLGLRGYEALVVILLANLTSVILLFAVLRQTLDVRFSFLVTTAISLSVTVQASHVYLGYPDAVSNLLLLAVMTSPGALVWLLAPALGLLNDERILIGFPLVMLFQYRSDRSDRSDGERCAVRRLLKSTLAAGVGIALAVGARMLITDAVLRGYTGPIYPISGLFEHGTWLTRTIGWAGSFRALWLLPFACLFFSLKMRRPTEVRSWSAALILVCAAAVATTAVADIWRSMGQVFPVFVLACAWLHANQRGWLERWMPRVVLAQIVIPVVDAMGPFVRWVRPLPVSVLELVLGKSVLSIL
jgi:hypothetical protein